MPTYVFTDENERLMEIFMSHEEYAERIFSVAGKKGQYLNHKGQSLKRVYVPFGGISTVWPKRSQAAGVAVGQIEEQQKYDREHGLNTTYDKRTGDAIFTSMEHQRKHLRHHGLIDRDSFY